MKNAFLRQFEPFICLTKLPQSLILHICWRNATVRCILLCSKFHLSRIKPNPVAIDIPAEICTRSPHKQKRHWIQSFSHSYQQKFPLIVTLGSNLPLGISSQNINEIEFRVIFMDTYSHPPSLFTVSSKIGWVWLDTNHPAGVAKLNCHFSSSHLSTNHVPEESFPTPFEISLQSVLYEQLCVHFYLYKNHLS